MLFNFGIFIFIFRKYDAVQYRATSNIESSVTVAEASTSFTTMEHCSLSASEPKTDRLNSSQAGTSDSTAKFLGRVGHFMRNRRPAKLIVGESSELVDVNSKNATLTEITEKPRMIKTRYARMQPNLKFVQKSDKCVDEDGQKASLVVVSEAPGEGSTEDKDKQQKKEDKELASTPESSEMGVVSVKGVSKELLEQSTSGIHSAKTKTTKAVTAGKTRSRYLRTKPNLLKRVETKASEVGV